jgi:hypothetical protein
VPASDLFTNEQFASWLQETVNNSTTDVCRLAASGWLMSATGLAAWPLPIPDDLSGWALELAAIFYRNPAGASSETIDDYTVAQDASRRREILAAARDSYGGANVPQYSFPDWDWHWTSVTPSGVLTN